MMDAQTSQENLLPKKQKWSLGKQMFVFFVFKNALIKILAMALLLHLMSQKASSKLKVPDLLCSSQSGIARGLETLDLWKIV